MTERPPLQDEPRTAPPRRRLGPRASALALALGLVVLLPVAIALGSARIPLAQVGRGVLALCGWGSALDATLQTIVELRTWRALTAAGVGASLALSGGFVQGLFRNPLASPSLLGVTGGASLGVALAVLALGGYAPRGILETTGSAATAWLPVAGFVGALAAVGFVAALAAPGGRLSTPTLLLVGIAVNMCIGGAFAALQSLSLRDWEVSRAIMAWTFGTLDDRSAAHAATVGLGLLAGAVCIPLVARELDLFQGGEADAEGLGVHVQRVRVLSMVAAALSASAAVAVAGQIAFIGLIVPHVVRLTVGPSHRVLLPLSALAGAVFLLGTDTLQRAVLGEGVLAPGVMMSILGGPFFLWLLLRHRREVSSW